VCGDGLCNGDEDYYNCPDDCNAPGECDAGYVTDCVDDDCCPESWIGDGFEDCEDQAYGCDLTCYDNDGGDCDGGSTTTGGTTGVVKIVMIVNLILQLTVVNVVILHGMSMVLTVLI